MASGNYPLSHESDEGKKLIRAVELIESVIEEVGYDANQYDNAANDGQSRAMLRMAIRLIEDEIAWPGHHCTKCGRWIKSDADQS